MPELSEALQKLMSWFENYTPEKALEFEPGLSPTEIEHVLSQLNFPVPHDVVKLYEWRNGMKTIDSFSDFYAGYTFLPLEYGIKEHFELCETYQIVSESDSQIVQLAPDNSLPFLQFQGNYYSFQGGGEKSVASSIYHISDTYQVDRYYDSLLGMILTIVECYESGIYRLNQGGSQNPEALSREKETRFKYNPGSIVM